MADIEPHPGTGGWNSGSMADPAEDDRPQFAPAALVFEVQDILARAGITVNPGPGQMHVASLAAADLLRALGVAPATAPERRS